MNMNWKVRIKNPTWWIQAIISIVAPIMGYLGITSADITTWTALWEAMQTAISNPHVIGLALLGVWHTLNDPTTKGLFDSKRAMSYDTPTM